MGTSKSSNGRHKHVIKKTIHWIWENTACDKRVALNWCSRSFTSAEIAFGRTGFSILTWPTFAPVCLALRELYHKVERAHMSHPIDWRKHIALREAVISVTISGANFKRIQSKECGGSHVVNASWCRSSLWSELSGLSIVSERWWDYGQTKGGSSSQFIFTIYSTYVSQAFLQWG